MDLEDTVERLAPRLVRYCSALCGDPDLGSDAAQSALVVLVQRWRKGQIPESPDAYSFAIARRKAFRMLLRRKLWSPLEVLTNHHGRGVDPEAQASAHERRNMIFQALKQLNRSDRDVLALVAAGQVQLREAAALLGVSESAVKMRVHRARRRLREQLGETDV